jgi:uncharacterized membrane protein
MALFHGIERLVRTSCIKMATIGRLHVVLIHFPIALALVAAGAELGDVFSADERWRMVASVNTRLAAAFAVVAAVLGWELAAGSAGPLLDWHRWIGTGAAVMTVVSAMLVPRNALHERRWPYRVSLLAAALLIGVTAHLGGLLVWGTDFFNS